MKVRFFFIFSIIMPLVLASGAGATATSPATQEDLQYQVSLGPWSDVARVHLVLKESKPGHYRAEFFGAAQGMWRLLNRWLPERFTTEMVFREGRLMPLVYREEFLDNEHHWVKEYRFDYEHRRLTLRRQIDGGAWVKKWEVPLATPVYDLLSLFYNVRLGALGPLRGGANLPVTVLSGKPRKFVFRLGKNTSQGLEVMLNYRLPDSDTDDQYFIYLNPQRLATQAWTRVTLFGKMSGHLLNPGEVRKDLLPAQASKVDQMSNFRAQR
jgi:hypothetical protein